MKGLAFALDPDRYWVEIVKRSPVRSIPPFEWKTVTMNFCFSDSTLTSNLVFLPSVGGPQIFHQAYKYDAEVKSNFSQTMLRIKDPTKSVAFYRE